MPTRGFTVFFTGLPAAGKSTLARELRARLIEATDRAVKLMDGDSIRARLSPDLGFSPADRHENVRRVAHAAAAITRDGDICICALIAPADNSRKAARCILSSVGPFFLVYVSTPIDVCEARDQRGLYARARAGKLPEFTGISAPYEAPDDADIVVDTTTLSPDACVDIIVKYLKVAL
jgi:sulfate adenylyltransferase